MTLLIPASTGLHHVLDGGRHGEPALVFVNSLGTDHRMWSDLCDRLPAGLRAIRYDKIGHGLSAAGPRRRIGMGELVDDLERVLEAGECPAVCLVGASIGGHIAALMATRRPDLVKGLVIVGSTPTMGTPQMWTRRFFDVATSGMDTLARQMVQRWFPAGFLAANPPVAALYETMVARCDVATYCEICQALIESDVSQALRDLEIAPLLVCGEEDVSASPAAMLAMAQAMGGARLEILEGCGHMPAAQQPEAVAALIGEYAGALGITR